MTTLANHLLAIAHAECEARARRTGIPERPGRLPMVTGAVPTAVVLRTEQVYAAIAAGCGTVAQISRRCGGMDASAISVATSSLLAQGRITAQPGRHKAPKVYRVAS